MTETIEIAARGMCFTADAAGPADGETVIFLHGFPNSRHSWPAQMDAVAAAGFRGIAYDQRGYSAGARPEGIEAYHVDEIVADVAAIADAVGADRFHLAGHDWGGQIAWLTAIAHADRLRSLTVLSRPHPAAFARAFKADPAQQNRSRHHKAFQDPGMADRLLKNGIEPLRNTLTWENATGMFGVGDGAKVTRRMSDAQADAHLSVLKDRPAIDAALNWYRAAFGGGSTLAREETPRIAVPTLYLWGTEDISVGRAAAEGTAGFIDAPYRFVEIEGAGHFLAEEVPETVNAALVPHLEANRG
ncbi:MAG: alpha/beta fold hydrolase [Minwuia sp.]|uniref:alpha/beta fold hydrolase n=1 Tax=Minwuia sp. TaxID=2493630 RepID=UPI003A86F0DA